MVVTLICLNSLDKLERSDECAKRRVRARPVPPSLASGPYNARVALTPTGWLCLEAFASLAQCRWGGPIDLADEVIDHLQEFHPTVISIGIHPR